VQSIAICAQSYLIAISLQSPLNRCPTACCAPLRFLFTYHYYSFASTSTGRYTDALDTLHTLLSLPISQRDVNPSAVISRALSYTLGPYSSEVIRKQRLDQSSRRFIEEFTATTEEGQVVESESVSGRESYEIESASYEEFVGEGYEGEKRGSEEKEEGEEKGEDMEEVEEEIEKRRTQRYGIDIEGHSRVSGGVVEAGGDELIALIQRGLGVDGLAPLSPSDCAWDFLLSATAILAESRLSVEDEVYKEITRALAAEKKYEIAEQFEERLRSIAEPKLKKRKKRKVAASKKTETRESV
jgi:hypothetical protein